MKEFWLFEQIIVEDKRSSHHIDLIDLLSMSIAFCIKSILNGDNLSLNFLWSMSKNKVGLKFQNSLIVLSRLVTRGIKSLKHEPNQNLPGKLSRQTKLFCFDIDNGLKIFFKICLKLNFVKPHKISTQSDNQQKKMNELNEVKLCEVSRNSISNRC